MEILSDNIYILGDIHGRFTLLNKFIEKFKPEFIFQVGDFGWFPNLH